MMIQAVQRLRRPQQPQQIVAPICIFITMIAPEIVLRLQPVLGVYVTAVSFVALLALALRWETTRKLAIAAAIWPLTMLLTAVLPQTDTFKEAGVLYDTLLLLSLFYEYLFSLDEPAAMAPLGKYYGVAVPLMIVLGEALGTVGFGMLRHQYQFRGVSLPLVATVAVAYGVAEELYFRGLVQQQAARCLRPLVAAALTTVVYGAANTGQGSGLPIAFAVVSGAVLSTVYYFKPNIVLTSTINATMKLTYMGLLATFVLR